MHTVLHYIHDPLCGWCYAAEPLVEALCAANLELDVRLHGGGLFDGEVLPMTKRTHIREADRRIAQISGQQFGVAYLDGLLVDPETEYDSAPPIAAILAAECLNATAGLSMLRAVQYAHYRDGRPVVDAEVLTVAATSIGLSYDAFRSALNMVIGGQTRAHMARTRDMMDRFGANGFPTFVLERGDRTLRLRHDSFYGDPTGFLEHATQALSNLKTATL